MVSWCYLDNSCQFYFDCLTKFRNCSKSYKHITLTCLFNSFCFNQQTFSQLEIFQFSNDCRCISMLAFFCDKMSSGEEWSENDSESHLKPMTKINFGCFSDTTVIPPYISRIFNVASEVLFSIFRSCSSRTI